MDRARYNSWYKSVKGNGVPRYLKKDWGGDGERG